MAYWTSLPELNGEFPSIFSVLPLSRSAFWKDGEAHDANKANRFPLSMNSDFHFQNLSGQQSKPLLNEY